MFGIGNDWGLRMWMIVRGYRSDGSCVDSGRDSSNKILKLDSK